MRLDKSALRQMLEGYRKASEVMFQERVERLQRLTIEEARKEFDILCATWYSGGARKSLGDLEQRRISFLVERRRRLNSIWTGWLK